MLRPKDALAFVQLFGSLKVRNRLSSNHLTLLQSIG